MIVEESNAKQCLVFQFMMATKEMAQIDGAS